MQRRNFLKLTGTLSGGMLLLPDFLYSYGMSAGNASSSSVLVFIQLDGGNDGLNTYIPYDDPLYYNLRPAIALSKNEVIGKSNGMAWHPAMKHFAEIQQNGHLTVIQNVGYPQPVTSHFRSQEIWQTASGSYEYLSEGWLGRYLDAHYREHHPTAALNIDQIDNLALKGKTPNSITLTNPAQFKVKQYDEGALKLSDNPRLDFVRKVAANIPEGAEEIHKALAKAKNAGVTYPINDLGKNLEFISKLIKGNLNSGVYYTSLPGFDTHSNQLNTHKGKLNAVSEAVYSFYKDMKAAQKLDEVTIVIFSEFGRRAKDNGKGTDHGTAAPMFVIGGRNKGKVIGNNPDLAKLDENQNLIHQIDFRSVYASLLKDKLSFDPAKIGIKNPALTGLF
jgi:uncharacterized protein (DUF1501 family)